MSTYSHHWLRGSLSSHRRGLVETLELPPPLLPTIDAHRRLRGPYAAAGTLLRAVVPDALDRVPDLVHAHDIEILSTAPELRAVVPASRETLTSLAIPQERTRFYSRLRTLRMAHGLAEFVRDYLRALDSGPRLVVVDNADQADITDQELLSVLLRRVDPAVLTLVVGTGSGAVRDGLATALSRYAVAVDVGPLPPADPTDAGADERELARRHVASDCVDDDPAALAAYDRLEPAERARLHDQRADELEARGELSLRLGAIPYHRERGSDPTGAGAQALRFGLNYCIDMGFYEATIDFGERGRALVGWEDDQQLRWDFTTKMTTSLGALGRADEAEVLYNEARAALTHPLAHMQAAYATAMIYTRHHADDRKDHHIAKGWINEAVVIADLLPDSKDIAFRRVFQRNGLALVEMHLGNLDGALRLVSEGLERLDHELDPDEHRLHRSVLRHNRAQLYARMERLDEALADFNAVIELDPNYSEYYFDRGNLLRRMGRHEEALADYEQAMRLSPPYPEVYYNRGDLRAELGDVTGALADYDYVLELDPDHLDTLINRAALLCELEELDAARRDVDAGLALAPDNAHLRCLLGRLEMEAGRTEQARAALDAAVAADPGLAVAWATRGVLAFESGDAPAAVADLTTALDLADDPAVRFNRATAYQACERWADAVADLTHILSLGVEDPDVFVSRGRCLIQLGDLERARADLLRCVELDPDRTDEVVDLVPELAGDLVGAALRAAADDTPGRPS